MMGSEGYTTQGGINKIIRDGINISSRTIGPPTQTGSGLNDFSNGGEFTGNEDIEYELEIVTTGTPDAFQLSRNGEVITASVPIDGSNQDLGFGVTGKFDATTGHDLGDIWTFTARAADPTTLIKTIVDATTLSLPATVSQTIGPFDLRNVEAIALSIGCIFDGAATAGISVEAFTSPDNITYDVDPYASTGLEPTFVAGGTAKKTSIIDTPVRFIKFVVTNLDTVKAIGGQPGSITKLER